MSGTEKIIRPAAVLPERAAVAVVTALQRNDVSVGGVWNATTTVWQRYDRPWDGIAGSRGTAALLGSIAVVYDSPARREITIYKVSVTDAGLAAGWGVESLTDDALTWAGLTLRSCPRATLASAPPPDPFRRKATAPLS